MQVSAGNFTKGGESMNIAAGLGSATTLTREDAAAMRGLANVVHVAAGLRSRTFITASPESRVFTLVHGTEESLGDIHGWTWLDECGVTVSAVRRRGIRALSPGVETRIEAGDVVVLLGGPTGLEAAEQRLLGG